MKDASSQTYDAIVVGTGAAGPWAAKELTEHGLSVLLLEAGRDIDKKTDFPHERRLPRDSMMNRMGAAMRGQSIQARCGSFNTALSHFYVNDRKNPYETSTGKRFNWFRGRQLGGRMHTWCRAALRMSDSELGNATGEEPRERVWPIEYADLEPYYDKVEGLLGVHGSRDGLPNLPDGPYIDPFPLHPTNRLFMDRVQEKLGLKLIQNRVVRHNPDRVPIPLTLALKTGRLDLRTDAVVSHIIIDKDNGKATGVGCYDRNSKEFIEYRSRMVFLCASTLESVRILLNSSCDQHPEGIGASSGALGRFVADHIMVGLGGRVSDDYRERKIERKDGPSPFAQREPFDFGAYCMYLPDYCGQWGRKPDFPGGYGIQCGASRFGWFALTFGEMEGRYENRVTLSKRKKDAWGIPAIRIDVRHSDNDNKMILHMKESIGEMADAVGFVPEVAGGMISGRLQRTLFRMLSPLAVGKNGAFHPGAAIHEIGGAPMGDDPKKSVVNPFCQVWDVPNVFVTDGACFVSSGYQNHTLTIMALTLRACDYVLREYKKDVV